MLARAIGEDFIDVVDLCDQDEPQLSVPGGAAARSARFAIPRPAEGLPQ